VKRLVRTECGSFSRREIGKEVRICGWVWSTRDHGGVVFLDVRDRSGLVQVVVHPDTPKAHELAHGIRQQDVIEVEGVIVARAPETVNPKIPTGEVELKAREIRVLNRSQTPPFPLDEADRVDEVHRLTYRYLDLRRPQMQQALILRHRMTQAARRFLDEHGFLEIETPMLTRSTPEGARDYLAPSRIYPGRFFALPQSPQLFKQLLMVAGFERYYQIARCFRDEDLRADRQPEFSQVDFELSFVEREDVMEVAEGVLRAMLQAAGLADAMPAEVPRMRYEEAIARFGTDRPDLRIPLELVEVTDLMREVDFKVFREPAEKGGLVKVLRVPEGARLTRKQIDDYTAFVGRYGAKGLALIKINDPDSIPAGLQSPIVKFLPEEVLRAMLARVQAKAGDILFFGAGMPDLVNEPLARLRVRIGKDLGLIDEGAHSFVWIVDFPMFEYDEEQKRLVALHHPFTAPNPEDLDRLEEDPQSVRSLAYDLVWNGEEVGGGSIRVHDPALQRRIFAVLQIDEQEAEEKFGFLLRALSFGAPPHGGFAFGLDRVVAMAAGKESIRDVIAFPKTQKAACPLTGAPAEVSEKQLAELHLRLRRTVVKSDE